MKKLYTRYRELILYALFGIATTATNVIAYHVCYHLLGIPNVPSDSIAWALSVAVAFTTNKLWVFNSKSLAPADLLPELWKFVGCRAVTGLLDVCIMWVGVDLLRGPATPLKLASNVVVIALNYLFSKVFIFG